MPTKQQWYDTINAISDKQYDEINSFEVYTNREFEKPLAEITRVPKEHIPPEEGLTNEQLSILLPKLEDLLIAWHFVPDYPDAVPMRLKYSLLRELWDQEYIFMAEGNIHLDFCGGICENCQILQYCPTGLNSDIN